MIKNRKGQMTVEAVLILTIMVALAISVKGLLQKNQILSTLVDKPWSYLTGMIENGVWMPRDQARLKHPNLLSRHGSPTGQDL